MLQGKAMQISCADANIPSWVKIPLNGIVSIADHTYVKCVLNGTAWGCHGRSSGGQVIAAGAGCDAHAGCIYGNDEAGIEYLLTGVCHQIANRTLISANVTVHNARFYTLSSATYGDFGLYHTDWNNRKKECDNTCRTTAKRIHLYQALISKRAALQKNPVPVKEIEKLFPNVNEPLTLRLQSLTTAWKIEFLKYAIEYYKGQDFQQFYNYVHAGLNKYSNECAGVIGYEAMANLLGLEDYDERHYILLSAPLEQS
ncbi:hypothetical protein [Vibrio sp. 2-2(8)]|uniref:hypothetical protein n=1 Tax=Vibrio sp. 2-2(8) TaxID=2591014 RepID=UPI00148310C7|nr:hypothetical protein [Vibrio sp. 2-2(8)]NNN49765.1 hypothetical protein [Vibrio sp. 2-2(8)]